MASVFVPELGNRWSHILASPWLSLILVVITILSVRRHGELAYGSYHARPLGYVLLSIYILGQLLMGVAATNLGFISLLLIVVLSDSMVVSISRSRSPFFVFNLGFVIGLLALIHPSFLILSFFYVNKPRMIKSATARHLTAFFIGFAATFTFVILCFSTRSWVGVQGYCVTLLAPLLEISLPSLKHLPVLIFDAAYLGTVTIAIFQIIRNSTVRVRVVMAYHIQLAWILMVLHLLYGIRDSNSYVFLISSIFLSAVMIEYLLTEKQTRWIHLPLTIILIATVGVRVWLFLGQPTL